MAKVAIEIEDKDEGVTVTFDGHPRSIVQLSKEPTDNMTKAETLAVSLIHFMAEHYES